MIAGDTAYMSRAPARLTRDFWFLSPLLRNTITPCVEIGNGNVERAFSTKTVTGFNKIRTGNVLKRGFSGVAPSELSQTMTLRLRVA